MLPSFHALSIDAKRLRDASTDNDPREQAVTSKQVYGNAEKSGIREAFASAARCGVLVYLDDTGTNVNSSATAYFLKIGFRPHDLRPVNLSQLQCLELSDKMGVDCIHMDIASYLRTLAAMSVGGVWLDYTGYTVDMQTVKDAMTCAKYVVTVTFTSAHASISSVKNCPNPPTDQYARRIMQEIYSQVIDGESIQKTWQCTSLQVYGAATMARELNMINLQFQRRITLSNPMCEVNYDTSRVTLGRPSRIISNVNHEKLYAEFERRYTIKDTPVYSLNIFEGQDIGFFFSETSSTPLGWYKGTVTSIKRMIRSDDGEHWQVDTTMYFEGEGTFPIRLDSFYYLSTPHKPDYSWVILASTTSLPARQEPHASSNQQEPEMIPELSDLPASPAFQDPLDRPDLLDAPDAPDASDSNDSHAEASKPFPSRFRQQPSRRRRSSTGRVTTADANDALRMLLKKYPSSLFFT